MTDLTDDDAALAARKAFEMNKVIKDLPAHVGMFALSLLASGIFISSFPPEHRVQAYIEFTELARLAIKDSLT